MTVRELIDILNTCDENANVLIEQWDGYEVTYNDGYKSWCPKSIFEHTYFEIKFDDKLSPEATVSSFCVKPENYDINIGKKYAIEKAKDQIWSGLGFVLQWAINGLKKK
nr:MAG: hypothetical protein [Bacteriophage sp.]